VHYLLILFVALALTIAWQTSVVADNPSLTELRCAEYSVAGQRLAAANGKTIGCE
jgi:hypothetical protein